MQGTTASTKGWFLSLMYAWRTAVLASLANTTSIQVLNKYLMPKYSNKKQNIKSLANPVLRFRGDIDTLDIVFTIRYLRHLKSLGRQERGQKDLCHVGQYTQVSCIWEDNSHVRWQQAISFQSTDDLPRCERIHKGQTNIYDWSNKIFF